MYKKQNWQLYTNQERHQSIDEIKDTISANDGAILNFNFFSDLGMSICVEIEENKIHQLHEKLTSIGTVSELDMKDINKKAKKECLVFLNVHFAKGEGKMTIEIPDVPG